MLLRTHHRNMQPQQPYFKIGNLKIDFSPISRRRTIHLPDQLQLQNIRI